MKAYLKLHSANKEDLENRIIVDIKSKDETKILCFYYQETDLKELTKFLNEVKKLSRNFEIKYSK